MNTDLSGQPEFVQDAAAFAGEGLLMLRDWALSPEAWIQFGLLIAAYLLALLISLRLKGKLRLALTPDAGAQGALPAMRRGLLLFLPLLMPLLAYAFAALGETVALSVFDEGAVIAFGKRIFLFLAVRSFVHHILSDPLLKLVGRYVLVPVAALYALGLLGPLMSYLNALTVTLGNISFSVMALLRGVIAGSFLFWLGGWTTRQSAEFIEQQKDMRPSLRQLVAKVIEFGIFGIAFLLLMNIMGINLSALAVIGGAIGVGLGFGLQKIASNFISGVILLVEGQATVGDYVELDGGQAGRIVKMTARSAILETYDGRWIVVPNEDFITTRVINYSDAGSANRYEAPFSVSYDTDINKVPAIIEAAVATHPGVLSKPYPPDCELRGFGDSGIDFAVEFWVNGIDDGPNKYTSDVLFLIWNALKDNGIEIPYPHRVLEIKGQMPKASA